MAAAPVAEVLLDGGRISANSSRVNILGTHAGGGDGCASVRTSAVSAAAMTEDEAEKASKAVPPRTHDDGGQRVAPRKRTCSSGDPIARNRSPREPRLRGDGRMREG